MVKRCYIIFVLFIATVISSLGADLEMSPKLEMGILPNGLTYYIYPNEKPENRASLHLVIGAGSLQEDEDQLGLAHFLEHMAFNGTTNYPENELVKYLQSTGMRFGADLNAHTGFAETVYKLQVPTDNPEEFERAFEVLKEWATEITFLPKDVEEEKNIILEEWRMRQGLSQRLSDAQKKAVFGDSRYVERFPIGDPEIVRNATPELLKRYYKKWYVPSNMAVIAVGDFDRNEIMGLIDKYFNYGEKSNPDRGEYRLGKGKGDITVFTDPEITQSMFDMIVKDDRRVITDKEGYREYTIQQLFTGILENRYSWEAKGKDPKFRQGYSYHFPMGPKDQIHIVGGLLRGDDLEAGIYEIQRYLKTMANYDVSQVELEGEKANLTKTIEDMVANRSSMESESFTRELKNLHLDGEIFVEIGNQYEVYRDIIDGITTEDIRRYAARIYNSTNVDYFISAPSNNGVKAPSKERVREIVKEVRDEKAAPYEIDLDNIDLVMPDIPRGKIVDMKDEGDSKRYILSNGIEVITKDTPFDRDKISMKIFMDGGSSKLDYEDYLSTDFIEAVPSSGVGNLNAISQDVYLKDKNLSITPYVRDYGHGMDIKTVRKDFETTLALNYLLLTDYKVDPVIFNNIYEQKREEIKNRSNSPGLVYRDRFQEIASGGHPRRKPMTQEEAASITEDGVADSYRELFGDLSGAKVIIVGSLAGLPMEDLIEEYIGSLPVKGDSHRSQSLGIALPEGVVEEDVVKGVDKKTTVTIVYPYRQEYTYTDRVKYLASSQILENIMLEDVREKIGGVYSIRSSAVLSPLTKGENYLIIRFTTDPARRKEVTDAVKKSVDRLVKGDYPDRMVNNAVENYRYNYPDMLRKNDFWMSYLYRREAYGDRFEILTPEEYRGLITKKNLKPFIKKAIDEGNYIEVNLVPERYE